MQKTAFVAGAVVVALALAAQDRTPGGTATDVTNDAIMAAVNRTAASAVSDVQLRVVNIDDQYNIGVGVVHRSRAEGKQSANGIEHSQITEIYHVIEGSATLVTGGTLENAKAFPPTSQVVKVLNGPSSGGGAILNGTSRKIHAGDVVVIPPNTPHWFSQIDTDRVVYLVIRVDPHKVLPAGYSAK